MVGNWQSLLLVSAMASISSAVDAQSMEEKIHIYDAAIPYQKTAAWNSAANPVLNFDERSTSPSFSSKQKAYITNTFVLGDLEQDVIKQDIDPPIVEVMMGLSSSAPRVSDILKYYEDLSFFSSKPKVHTYFVFRGNAGQISAAEQSALSGDYDVAPYRLVEFAKDDPDSRSYTVNSSTLAAGKIASRFVFDFNGVASEVKEQTLIPSEIFESKKGVHVRLKYDDIIADEGAAHWLVANRSGRFKNDIPFFSPAKNILANKVSLTGELEAIKHINKLEEFVTDIKIQPAKLHYTESLCDARQLYENDMVPSYAVTLQPDQNEDFFALYKGQEVRVSSPLVVEKIKRLEDLSGRRYDFKYLVGQSTFADPYFPPSEATLMIKSGRGDIVEYSLTDARLWGSQKSSSYFAHRVVMAAMKRDCNVQLAHVNYALENGVAGAEKIRKLMNTPRSGEFANLLPMERLLKQNFPNGLVQKARRVAKAADFRNGRPVIPSERLGWFDFAGAIAKSSNEVNGKVAFSVENSIGIKVYPLYSLSKLEDASEIMRRGTIAVPFVVKQK